MSSPSSQPSVVVHQTTGWERFVSWLGWSLFTLAAISLMVVSVILCGFVGFYGDYFDTTGGISEKYVSGSKSSSNKIAILSIEGVIMEGDGFVKHQIDRIKEDDAVKAVVVRVDSPGGTVTGSDYIYHHITKLREEKKVPVVVSMGAIAASGGYYVSMAVGDQEKSIYAEPTTTTGSIGVIIPHYNVTGLMQEWKIEDDSIASGPRKQMLSMTRQLTEEERKLVQEYVMESFSRFKDIIKTGRPAFRENPEKLDELATGEIFTANKAKSNGLVDEIGFLEDVVARAAELAGLSESTARVVKYERPPALFDLGDVGAAEASRTQLGLLFELSTPKAYYMSTTLPAIFSTNRAD